MLICSSFLQSACWTCCFVLPCSGSCLQFHMLWTLYLLWKYFSGFPEFLPSLFIIKCGVSSFLFTYRFTSVFLPLSILLLIDFAIRLIWLSLLYFIFSVICSFNNLSLSLRILFSQASVVFLIFILRFFLIFCGSLMFFFGFLLQFSVLA